MIKNFTPIELKQHLENNQPLLLDVREKWEYQKCHLEHSILLPMGGIMGNIDTLEKHQQMVIICHHGIRSMQVARYLNQIGFSNIINLQGGIDAWAKQIDSSMALY